MNNPVELKYTQSHEWVRVEPDGTVVVGITEYAQSSLGELVFVEVPDVDERVHQGDEVAVVESVKAASDVYAPLSGHVIAVNEDLEDAPSLVNQDPYGDGWLFKLKISDQEEYRSLLSAEDYEAELEEVET